MKLGSKSRLALRAVLLTVACLILYCGEEQGLYAWLFYAAFLFTAENSIWDGGGIKASMTAKIKETAPDYDCDQPISIGQATLVVLFLGSLFGMVFYLGRAIPSKTVIGFIERIGGEWQFVSPFWSAHILYMILRFNRRNGTPNKDAHEPAGAGHGK